MPTEIAVSGDTFDVREELKDLHAYWCREEKCWFLPKDQESEVRRICEGRSVRIRDDYRFSRKTMREMLRALWDLACYIDRYSTYISAEFWRHWAAIDCPKYREHQRDGQEGVRSDEHPLASASEYFRMAYREVWFAGYGRELAMVLMDALATNMPVNLPEQETARINAMLIEEEE